MSRANRGFTAGVLAIAFLSSYSIFGKVLLEHFPPHTLAAVTQTMSAVMVLLFFGALPEFKKLLRLPVSKLIVLFVIAILAAVIAPLLLLRGLQLSTATNSVLIGSSEAVLVELMALFLLHERLSLKQVGSFAVMIAGIYVIVSKGFTESINFVGGDVLIFLAAASWALATNLFKKYLHHLGPDIVVLTRNTIGALVLFALVPVLFNLNHELPASLNGSIIINLLLFAFIVIILGQFLWYKALELIPTSKASAIELTAPLFGVALAVLILGERLYSYHLYGGALVMSGLFFIFLKNRHHPPHHVHHVHREVKHFRG